MFKQAKGIRKPFPYRDYNVAFMLIGVNVTVYFFTMIIPGLWREFALSLSAIFIDSNYWTPLTYMFTHANMSHIIFNMLGLFFFGPQLERRMGSWEFLTFYLVSGVLSGLISLGIYYLTGMNVRLVGASGAIFAILLAYAVYYPNAVVYLFFVIPVKTKVIVPLFAAFELFQQVFGTRQGVGHLTHLAGFAVGFVYFLVRFGINPITALRDSGRSHWQ